MHFFEPLNARGGAVMGGLQYEGQAITYDAVGHKLLAPSPALAWHASLS